MIPPQHLGSQSVVSKAGAEEKCVDMIRIGNARRCVNQNAHCLEGDAGRVWQGKDRHLGKEGMHAQSNEQMLVLAADEQHDAPLREQFRSRDRSPGRRAPQHRSLRPRPTGWRRRPRRARPGQPPSPRRDPSTGRPGVLAPEPQRAPVETRRRLHVRRRASAMARRRDDGHLDQRVGFVACDHRELEIDQIVVARQRQQPRARARKDLRRAVDVPERQIEEDAALEV